MVRNNFKMIFASIAVIMAASCTKEAMDDPMQGAESVITATTDQTKTLLDGGVSVLWSEHEDISVLSPGANDRMRLFSGALTTTAQFRGALSEADSYVCFYPYDKNVSLEAGKVSFALPSEQKLTPGGFWNNYNPSVGTLASADGTVDFRNVCGILELQIKGSGSISKVVVKDNSGARLWGICTLDPATLALSVSGGSDELVLDCPQGHTLTTTATSMVFVVPAGSFAQGFTATIHAIDGSTQVISSDKDNTIHRSMRRVMPAKTVNFAQSFSIVNPVAAAFLNQVTYDGSDYEYSYIRKYSDQSTSYRKDQPNALTLKWSTVTGASSIDITVSENADYSDAKVYHPLTVYTTSYDLTNFAPGRNYYYKVESKDRNGTAKLLTSGSIKTGGSLRMIKADGCFNIRDFGGWTSTLTHADGTPKHTRYGMIFRGSNVDGISKDHAAFMREDLGIKRELDLRTDYKSDPAHASTFGEGVEYVCIGVDNIFYEHLGNSNYYHYINMFNCVMNSVLAGEPIYFHCAVGADRTGTLAFLVDGVLGYSESDLSKDYELTSFSTSAGTRVRTDEGYKYATMVAIVKQSPGLTMQQKVYNYLTTRGVDAAKLDLFIDTMLE